MDALFKDVTLAALVRYIADWPTPNEHERSRDPDLAEVLRLCKKWTHEQDTTTGLASIGWDAQPDNRPSEEIIREDRGNWR